MLKKIRKRLRQRRLAAAMALALAMACPAAPAFADTGKQTFHNGLANTVADNITVTDDNGLEVYNDVFMTGTSATMTSKAINVSGASPGQGVVALEGGIINLTDVTVNVTGSGGIRANGSWGASAITMTGGSITADYGALAEGNSTITLNNVDVRATADTCNGVSAATFDGKIYMTGGAITTTGAGSNGAAAYDYGVASLTGVTIGTAGAGSHGLYANLSANIGMSGGSITTTGNDSHGAYASNDSGAITLTNVAVRTEGTGTGPGVGNGAYGVYADNDGRVTVTGGSITTIGNYGRGAYAKDTGYIELTNVAVRTEGEGSHGVGSADYAPGPGVVTDGTIKMTGGSITTTGNDSHGAHAAYGGIVELKNTDVSTAGLNSQGVRAEGAGSRITMEGGSITTNGAAGHGAFSNDNGAIFLNNVTVSTSRDNTYGVYAERGIGGTGGSITVMGGSITTTGADSHGAYINNDGTVTLTNVAINADGADSFALVTVGGGTITATVNGQDISGAGGLMTAAAGTINLTAYGTSRLTGIAGASGGGTANLTLNDSSSWTSSAESYLTILTLNGGTVIQSRGAAGPIKLTVTGKLGGTGGTFHTSANINDINQSDLIVVQGLASGSHRVEAAVVGGYPADLYKVVRVVDVNNALANTATFGGGSDVRAYRYGVAKGSALPAAYSGVLGGHEDDFYLYNTFAPSTPANAAIGTSAAASVVWYGEMNEIKKRLGDLRMGAQSGEGFWARTYAGQYDVKPGDGQAFDQRMYGLEMGQDTPRKYAGGTRYLGWVAGAGRADRTFSLGGGGQTDSYYLGGYASWLADDGSYVDVVGKQNWFRHSFTTPLLGGGSDSAAYDNSGFGLSVETGKRFERGNGVFVEPQAELAALWTNGKNYTSANGLAVNARAETSLQLRVGAVVGKKTAAADGGSRQVYGKLAWVQELAGENRMTVDSVAFASSLKGGRLVFGLGFVEDSAKSQLYLDVETAWGKTTDKPWGINLGCRWKL